MARLWPDFSLNTVKISSSSAKSPGADDPGFPQKQDTPNSVFF